MTNSSNVTERIEKGIIALDEPAFKTMGKIKIVIQIMILLTFMAFCFVTFLNYQANLRNLVLNKQTSESISNIEAFLKENISTEPNVNLNVDLNAVETPND